ncbi:MAG: carbohydrate-binding family 9-like protein [Prevotella sp.]|nr:carbohydrate-binding family 9-like protein [Prevotella sp.]
MKIKKIQNQHGLRAEEVPQLMLTHGVEYQKVACVNWPKEFPYAPKMEVALAHTGDSLLLHYRVEENCIRAAAEADGGRVWEDSCCEIFLQPSSPITHHPTPYFNIECNCAGTLLIGKGEDRHDRQPATATTLQSANRWSSLMKTAVSGENGRYTIPLKDGKFTWHMALVVPATALFDSGITDFSGQTLRGNIYKCGDCLTTPHFLSLFPIETAQPDFHRPEFFGELTFE